MMIREDGPEKTKQLFVGMMVISLGVWLVWQWWFGQGLFEGKAFNNGPYGSGATQMVQMLVYLIIQVGALSLGLFRTGIDVLKYIGSFLFGSMGQEDVKPVLGVSSVKGASGSKLIIENLEHPLFRTNEQGLLYRDVQLEKQLAGPKTPDELASDAVDALMAGDLDRLNKRFTQLHPEKTSSTVEVKLDEPESKA